MRSQLLLPPDRCGQHRWLVNIQPDADDEVVADFLALLRGFTALGDAGAFLASDGEPTRCSMRILQERQPARGTLELLVEVRQCDIRYARPLRNVVFARGEILETPVLEFRAESALPGQPSHPLTAEVEPEAVETGRFYPGLSARFAAVTQQSIPANYRSGRRLWICCANILSMALVNNLIKLVDLWASILDCGFPVNEQLLIDGESIVLNVTSSQHDESTFEVLVGHLSASEAALFSLVNLLCTHANRENLVVAAGIG